MTDVLLHVLALEMALRDIEVPVTAELIPRWLSIGLPRALELRRRGRQSSFFKTLFKLNLITSAEDILNAEREHTDSVARTVYEASAAGFVLMLLDQKDGASALGKLIHSFGGAHGKSGHSLLARFYPALIGTSERLEQTWILYCAKLNEPQATEFLSPEETEAHLIDALSVSFLEFSEIDENTEDSSARTTPRLFERIFQARKNLSEQQEDEPSTPSEDRPTRMFEGSLKDFERFIAREDRADILAPVRLRLRQLDIRSFPLHRPLIVDYHEIVTDLLAGKPSGIQKRLEDLETKREQLATLMKNVAAHLNDYEASQPAARSGVFDNYLKQIKVIENNASTDPDPISQYLMEAEEVLK